MQDRFWDILPSNISNQLSNYIDRMAEFRRINTNRKANKLGRVRVERASRGDGHAVLCYGRKQFADYLSELVCSDWDRDDGEGLRRLALDLLNAYPKPKDGLKVPKQNSKDEWLKYYDVMMCRQLAYAIYDKRHRYFAIIDEQATAFDPSHIEYYGAF